MTTAKEENMKLLLPLILSLTSALGPRQALATSYSIPAPALTTNDVVYILGDSITWRGHWLTQTAMSYSNRHPASNVKFLTQGNAGYTAAQSISFVEAVCQRAPTVVWLEFGTNEMLASSGVWSQAKQDGYFQGYADIVAAVRVCLPSVPIVVFSPFAIEPKKYSVPIGTAYNNGNTTVAPALATWATAHSVYYVDVTQPLLDAYTYTASQSWSQTTDGIHPLQIGADVAAWLTLNNMGETGPTSDVTIALSGSPPVITTVSSSVTHVAGDNGVTAFDFDRKDDGLPTIVPATTEVDQTTGVAIGSARFASRYNALGVAGKKEGLKITGLASGTWKVSVDSISVGSWSAAALAAGLDLALCPNSLTYKTPYTKQNASVLCRALGTTNDGWYELMAAEMSPLSDALLSTDLSKQGQINSLLTSSEVASVLTARNSLLSLYDAILDTRRVAIQARSLGVTRHYTVRRTGP